MKHLSVIQSHISNPRALLKKKFFARSLACVFSIITLLLPTTVFAVSSTTLDFFDRNGIYYYNPDGFSSGCYPGLGSYDGIATAGLSDLQAAFVDTYHDIAAQLGAEYGIPWEAVMAQGIYESGAGTSPYARERNNFFGINAVDSNPDLAYGYPTPQDGWKGYFEFINNNSRYREHGAFNYPNNPYEYIKAILSANYATKATYFDEISPIIKAVENRAREKGGTLSSESSSTLGSVGASTNPTDSSSITSLSGPAIVIGTSSSTSTSYHSCSGSTYGNGNINQTALDLSWPDRTHDLHDAKPEYANALEVVGLSTYGDEYVRVGASCDAFVATVLRFSGADPNVVCCGAANMLNYFASHPELYEEIPNLDNSSNLQPGDIRARPSHVEIYVVDESGNGRIASASHGDRTADHARDFYANSEYRVFRFKGFNN